MLLRAELSSKRFRWDSRKICTTLCTDSTLLCSIYESLTLYSPKRRSNLGSGILCRKSPSSVARYWFYSNSPSPLQSRAPFSAIPVRRVDTFRSSLQKRSATKQRDRSWSMRHLEAFWLCSWCMRPRRGRRWESS